MDLDKIDAKKFLSGLKVVTGSFGPLMCSLGGGLDGIVGLYELEKDGRKQKVAVKTAKKPANVDEANEERAKNALENLRL